MMAKPVRLGTRTTRRMSRASQPDKQNGTLSVHTIRASGHVHRTNRPNRWGGCRPPQTASQCAKVVVFTATERKGRQP